MNNASGQPGAGWRGSDSEREGAREAEGVYEAFAHAHDSIKRYIDKATESGCSWKQLGALVVELILVPTLILARGIRPAPDIWTRVVFCAYKNTTIRVYVISKSVFSPGKKHQKKI